MATSGAQRPNMAVYDERLKNMDNGITKIEAGVSKLVCDFGQFHDEYLVEHAAVVNSANDAHAKIAAQDKRVESLERKFEAFLTIIQPLIHTNKIVVWVGGILGASLLGLVWMIITGQVTLVFK